MASAIVSGISEDGDAIKESIKAQFRLCDLESTGEISRSTLAQVLRTLDLCHWTFRRTNDLFDSMDSNKDGKIQIEEFVEWVFANSDNEETPSFFAAEEIELLQEKSEAGDLEMNNNDWIGVGACSACGPRPHNEDQHLALC